MIFSTICTTLLLFDTAVFNRFNLHLSSVVWNLLVNPKLTEFATSSTEFTNHYSTGNSNNAGLIGLFYELNANYTDSILSNHTQSVLIEKLRAEHYQLGLFSATNFKDSVFRQALFREIKLLSNKTNKPNNESAVKNLNDFIKAQKTDSLGLLI